MAGQIGIADDDPRLGQIGNVLSRDLDKVVNNGRVRYAPVGDGGRRLWGDRRVSGSVVFGADTVLPDEVRRLVAFPISAQIARCLPGGAGARIRFQQFPPM